MTYCVWNGAIEDSHGAVVGKQSEVRAARNWLIGRDLRTIGN